MTEEGKAKMSDLKALIVDDDVPNADMIKAVLNDIDRTKAAICGDGGQRVKMLELAAPPITF